MNLTDTLNHIFLTFFEMGVSSVVMLCVVLLLREYFIRKSLKGLRVLWILMLIKLLCPVSLAKGVVSATIFKTPSSAADQKLVISSVNENLPTITMDVSSHSNAVVSLVWIAGIAVLAVLGMISYLRLKAYVRLHAEKKGDLYIYGDEGAFVIGFFRQRIVISQSVTNGDEGIILHEKAHIRRHDNLKKLAAFCIVILYWYHPIIWFAYHCFCLDIELCCDDEVTGTMSRDEKKHYVDALLKYSMDSREYACLLNCFSFVDVKKRVRNLVRPHTSGVKKRMVFLAALAILSAAMCCIISCAYGTVDYEDMTERASSITKDMRAGGITDKCIVNAYGHIVFEHPEKALSELKQRYSYALNFLEDRYHLPAISRNSCIKYYNDIDWIIDSIDQDKDKTLYDQLVFVSGFADIYEN